MLQIILSTTLPPDFWHDPFGQFITYADMWHGFGNSSTLAHKMEVLDGWCKEVGRDPREIERSASTNKTDSDETRDACVKVGVTHLILGMGVPWKFDAVRDLVRWRDSRR